MHPLFNTTRRVLALLAGWSILTLSISILLSITTTAALADCLLLFVPLYFLSLLFILPNYYVCSGLPLGQTPWLILVGSQALTLLAVSGMWILAGEGFARLLDSLLSPPRWEAIFDQALYTNLAIVILQYEVIVLIHYLYFAIEKSRLLEQTALKQKILISQVELQTLKATVHPHFLFNSLNTLANIALSSPEKAHRFCLQLADFLRYSVAYSKKESATLNDELEHAQNYLGIERERFGERLETGFEIDESLRDTLMPPMILFPIVENAIKHGIDSCIEGGRLTLVARQKEGSLVIEVGNPVDELGSKRKGTGHGLSAVEQRLQTRYGKRARLKTSRENGRFLASIYLPIEQQEQQALDN